MRLIDFEKFITPNGLFKDTVLSGGNNFYPREEEE